jgi:hypothetical protein
LNQAGPCSARSNPREQKRKDCTNPRQANLRFDWYEFSIKAMCVVQDAVIKKSALEYKIGKQHARGRSMIVRRLTVGIGALAVGMAAAATAAEVQRGEAAITCTNVSSGTSWQIRVNYDKGTVDSNPARISEAEISWHDATDGGNYTLDRKSEKLTVIVASSTGGYSLFHRCRLQN